MSFADFKKRRKNKNSLDKIKNKIEEQSGGSYKDERYWSFEVDKSTGNGQAIIRFLPEPEGEDFPFQTWYEHAFQGPTDKWYIERSLTSLGKGTPDPVSESNGELWDTGVEENQNIVRKRKRHQKYVSNIYVVKDPKNPQNEGKVMLWKYGPAIFKLIEDAINPPEEFDDEPIEPFDLWEGANFKLKAYKDSGSGYRKYDKSAFQAPEALLDGDDEELEKIYTQMYSLEAEVAPEKYKSYDELKDRLDTVLGIKKRTARPVEEEQEADAPAPTTTTEAVTDTTDDESDLDYMSLLDDE